MFVELCLALALLLCFIDFYFRYNRAGRLMRRIPGPKILPLIGNSLDLSLDPELLFKFSRNCANKYGGSVCRLLILNVRVIIIYEPEDLEIVLSSSSSKFHEKPVPYTFLHPWLGEGLLTSSGLKWKHRRKLLTPAFHFNILKKFSQTFQQHTEELIELIKREVGEARSTVVDLKPLISNATLKIMCETSMGISKNTDSTEIGVTSNKYFRALQTIASCVVYRTSKVIYIPDFIFNLSKTSKIQKKALENLHDFTDDVIKKRRKCRVSDGHEREHGAFGSRGKRALLDLLLEQEDEGNIDAQGIREEVDTFMFEGHDTTSSTLRFMLMRIANEPIVQNRICHELKTIFGESNRAATMEDISEMKYLERCIKEALRLYPGVPFIARRLREETVLNGYTIPADTICSMNIYDIHRRDKLFKNPEEFDPDRFLPENVAKRHTYSFIPFSAGPRNCIGQKFAMLEIKIVVSGLLRKFQLEPVTRDEDIVYISDLVLQAKHPIYVKFIEKNI